MARTVVEVAEELRERIDRLRFAKPVAHVYNPLRYAWEPHRAYLERYAAGRREVLLVGMNPGPWGMVQTGVPFGDVGMVRDWLRVRGAVEAPRRQHPKRQVQGFDCPRGEVSGQRLWGWARERFGTPARFRRRFVVLNYCPLAFVEDSGRNRTPDRLSVAERRRLFAHCDDALRQMIDILDPRYAIGIGRFAEDRLREVLGDTDRAIARVPHPSPASPAANRDWATQMDAALAAAGIAVP